jgi:diketogulonate reductase-like aldo/keto reductase
MPARIRTTATLSMPPILYGTAWKKRDTAHWVRTAIQEGFRGFDTACQPKHYDEAGVGAGIALCLGKALRRADLYLQTKFTPVSGQDLKRIPYDPKALLPEQIAQSFAASLSHLETSYVDCLLLHSPLDTARQTLQAWRAMEPLADGGGVKLLGISNCYRLDELQALYDSARIKPAVLQNRFYAATRFDREIRAYCKTQGIIYQSFWTLSANKKLLGHATITALAKNYGRTPAQILFRWLTQSGVVPLTGTRSESHMREDLAIFEFALAERELETVDAMLASEVLS